MSRLPIRIRLTAVFALATTLVLAGAGLFVYLRLEQDLSETVDDDLKASARSLSTRGLGPSESFIELLDRRGLVVRMGGGARAPVLRPDEVRQALEKRVRLERAVPGIDGTTRVLARPLRGKPGVAAVVAGRSLDDHDEALAGLVRSFAIGGPVAVVLASLLGYGLATAGLAPMEAMRRRAGEVSLSGGEESLPLPVARDEVHRLGSTLNDMLARLRSSFEREQRFVADASHELRTPIAIVKTELEGALRARGLAPGVRVALAAAVEECDRLGQLAEDLLVVARTGDGGLPVRPETVAAETVLGDARDRFADRAFERGVTIRVEVPDGVRVWADPLRLRQALGNLVDNALRHGAGDVTLEAGPAGGGVELRVSDAGDGFGAELGARAFDRFARGGLARTGAGAGLGLSIVRAIVEAHGGRAAISGSAVSLWFPTG